jgi:anti-anti-sigma factor
MLALAGDLDYTNAEQLRGDLLRLFEPQQRHMVLDLTDLTFCDSTGIRIFLTTRLLAQQRGGVITLASLNARLVKVFQITGLSRAFAVQATLAEAVKFVQAHLAASPASDEPPGSEGGDQ